MRKNLLKFLKMSKNDLKKPITSIIEMNKPITLLDKENPKKKINTFKQISPYKCACGAFSLVLSESISLLVVPSSLKPKREKTKVGHRVIKCVSPETVVDLLECSSEYVKRLTKLVADYKIGRDGVSGINVHVDSMFADFDIDLGLDEKSTIKEMIDKVVHESDRFQSFLIDLNEYLPGYGSPRPIKTSLTVKITPSKTRKHAH